MSKTPMMARAKGVLPHTQDCDSTREHVAQLLRGFATEASTLGEEITRVGDAISGAAVASEDVTRMVEFQFFDLLAQNAHAQARVMARMAELLLSGSHTGGAEMREVLADMPIVAVKARLHQAAGLEPETHGSPASGEPDLWGDEE